MKEIPKEWYRVLNSSWSSAVLLVLAVFGTERPAHAFYVDPGNGTIAWQLLLAGLTAGAFQARGQVHKLACWLRTRRADKIEPNSVPGSDQIIS